MKDTNHYFVNDRLLDRINSVEDNADPYYSEDTDNTDAEPKGGETRKDEDITVRRQNVKLANQDKSPGQKQNTSTDGRKNEATTTKRDRQLNLRLMSSGGVWWYKRP